MPARVNPDGSLQTEADWILIPTLVKRHASIGSNATILPGVIIGEAAQVGAGAVVTKDVPDGAIVAGVRPGSSVTFMTDQSTCKRWEKCDDRYRCCWVWVLGSESGS